VEQFVLHVLKDHYYKDPIANKIVMPDISITVEFVLNVMMDVPLAKAIKCV